MWNTTKRLLLAAMVTMAMAACSGPPEEADTNATTESTLKCAPDAPADEPDEDEAAPPGQDGEDGEDGANAAEEADDEPSGHTPLLRAVYDALRSGDPLPPVAADPHRSLELVTAINAAATLGRPVTKADLAPGRTLRDGFLHGIDDLRPA